MPAEHRFERPDDVGLAGQPLVSILTYRSQSATPFEPAGIEGLLAKAKARNRSLGVTGMLLLAQDQFYQWLEGPPDSVEQVWDSIRSDPRHRQVELIDYHHQSLRLFGEWDMKLVCRDAPTADHRDGASVQRRLPPGLIHFIADLALKGDEPAITGGLKELLSMGEDFLTLHGALIEPAARLLGDWWLEDRIRATEIATSLTHLQSAVRRIGAAETDRIDESTHGALLGARHILIAAQPGETHGLGVALAGDAFRRRGWRVTTEFPTSIDALAACVGSSRFDALSLCLSDVFERVEQILPLADAIRAARAASVNPALLVLAGGRLFQARPDMAAFLGADAVYTGAAEALSKTATQMARAQRALRTVTTPPMH